VRTSRIAFLVVATAALTLAAAAAPDTGLYRYSYSWADARHGWRMPGGGLRVESTENGGRSWHTIYRFRRHDPTRRQLVGVTPLRTSATAGIITVLAYHNRQLWTADNGRHWHEAWAIGWDRYQGRGHLLFWEGGRIPSKLYRVTPWPPRHGRMSSELIIALPSGEKFGDVMQNIPQGVIDSIENASTLRLAVYRRGVLRQIDVAPATCGVGVARIARIVVAGWPRIVLKTGVLYPGLYKEERGPDWISDDEGATFRQEGTCHEFAGVYHVEGFSSSTDARPT
jgi:hypothetical protein